VSAVDLPPVIGLVGTTRASFRARPGGRRLAMIAMVASIAGWAISWYLLRNRFHSREAAMFAVMPITLFAVAGLGLAVRSARIWIDGGGVRWGYRGLHVRMEVERLVRVELYTDGVGLVAKKGSRWFLAARDWDRFELLTRELERSGMPIERRPRRAPLRARLQSYGRVLDGMMILTTLGALYEILAASSLPPSY
jgi:hypothetical protein